MWQVKSKFHELSIQEAPKTRCRIYFIDDSVDCTNDSDVITNGTLLARDRYDSDSNGRISNQGISFTDLMNSDYDLQIGSAVSKPIQLNLLNSDNALTNFAFGRCKIFIDVFDPQGNEWIPCPIGVFIIDAPVKRSAPVVVATGYDQMQVFDSVIDSWWSGLDFSSGLTMVQIVQSIATAKNIHLNESFADRMVNTTKKYYASPWTPVGRTFREALSYIAEATGTIAYFDRNGALDFRWFSEATIDEHQKVFIDGSSIGNQCLSVDVSDYSVTPIDGLSVLPSDAALNAWVGTGDNAYTIAGNPFLTGSTASDVESMATPIYNRLASINAYAPSAIRAVSDWSMESGDIAYLSFDGNIIPVLVMQQTMTWRGSYVTSNIVSSGNPTRPTMSEDKRNEYRTDRSFHEFENTATELRSLIRDLSGNYTLIQQTVNSIQQTVSAQGITINDILDPTGEIWTAITTNSTNLSNVESALNGEISERKSYIRFIPAEPAIVLGVDTGNEIKLKLVNNIIYFFNGDDDSTDLSLAYAYFNSEESGADRFVANESIQIGTDNSVARWQMKELANGDLVLDLI